MSLERVTHLTAPPFVGKRYLVPVVTSRWNGFDERAWPVYLPLHDDARFFNVKDPHYHIDPRFLDRKTFRRIGGGKRTLDWTAPDIRTMDRGFAQVQRWTIARSRWEETGDPPPHTWAERVCQRTIVPYQFELAKPVRELNGHYAGRQCKRARRGGWVCPHQNWPMGSIAPDADGVITCPLHGLRIRAADGVVIGSEAA